MRGRIAIVIDLQFTAVFRKAPEGFIALLEELPGANTQGATLEEARTNLEEAAALVLDADRRLAEKDPKGAEVIREPFTGTRCSEPIWFAISRRMATNSFAKAEGTRSL